MDKGPSQWRMVLPSSLKEEEAAAAEAAAVEYTPAEKPRRWSAMGGAAAATEVQIEGITVDVKELLSPRTVAAAAAAAAPVPVPAAAPADAATAPAEGAAAGDSAAATDAEGAAAAATATGISSCGRWCQVETQQRGCCLVSFNTMCYLLRQLQQANREALENAIISPTLPSSKRTSEEFHRAVLLQAQPIVLQSTLPLPQQVRV